MKKNVIRLTESQFQSLMETCVKEVIKEQLSNDEQLDEGLKNWAAAGLGALSMMGGINANAQFNNQDANAQYVAANLQQNADHITNCEFSMGPVSVQQDNGVYTVYIQAQNGKMQDYTKQIVLGKFKSTTIKVDPKTGVSRLYLSFIGPNNQKNIVSIDNQTTSKGTYFTNICVNQINYGGKSMYRSTGNASIDDSFKNGAIHYQQAIQ